MLRGLVIGLLLFGCDERAPPPPPSPDLEARVEAAEVELAEPAPSAWPTDVASLRDAIEAFDTVDACLASLRARTPTEISEAVTDLAYDAFFEDVCRSMRAVRDADVEGCDALTVSSAQRGCRRRLALLHGDPRACPADRARPGREAICVAWAARDPGLCRAAATPDRMRCAAVLSGDPAGCPHAERAECVAEVERYAGALGDERRTSPATEQPSVFELRVEALPIRSDALSDGVRVVAHACRANVELGGPSLGPVVGHVEEATFRLTLVIPAQLELPARLSLGAIDAVLEVATPEHGVLVSDVGARGFVELTAFEPHVGGAVEGTIEGRLSHLTETLPVHGRFSTFIRDIDPVDASCRAP